jgi:hypothetical protein
MEYHRKISSIPYYQFFGNHSRRPERVIGARERKKKNTRTKKQTHIQTCKHAKKETNKETKITNRQKNKRQTNKQANKQTDRQKNPEQQTYRHCSGGDNQSPHKEMRPNEPILR